MPDAVFESLLIHRVDIFKSEKEIQEADLRPNMVTASAGTSVLARLKAFGADKTIAMGGVVIDADFKLYLLPTQEIKEGYVVRLNDGSRLAGYYGVQGVEPYPDDVGVHHQTVYLKKLQAIKTT